MASKAQRKLAVVLHADVVGSTDLVQKDETLAHERITGTFSRFASVIRRYGGIVHEVRGDALVAEFTRASDAILAAIAFQSANAEHNRGIGDGLLAECRVGLGMGEVVTSDNTVTGAGVVVAQRVEQLAEGGGICVQGAVFETIPNRFPIDFKNLGEKELKGFTEPLRVYAASLRNGAVVPAPDFVAPTLTERLRRRRRPLAAAAVSVLVAAGLAVSWIVLEPDNLSPARESMSGFDKPSIAVLPFQNLSADPGQEYFSDGITNDIINALSRFSNLTVIAQNSVFAFKGKPTKVQNVARELGVRYVLEGSVQRANDRVRINVQFVDANSGRQLWVDRFDELVTNVFDLQDEITRRIVSAGAIRVTELEQRRALSHPESDFSAYDLVLQALSLLRQLTRAENFKARQLFREAIAIDPSYSTAHAGLGWTYMNAILWGWLQTPRAALTKAEAHARKAISLDQNCVDGHRLLARVHLSQFNHDLAILELERAIAINPNDAASHAEQGVVFVYSNRIDAAVRSLETALRNDPNMTAEGLMHLGMAYYLQNRYEDALAPLKRAVARNPDNVFIHLVLAATYGQLGRTEDAQQSTAAVRRLDPFAQLEQFGRLFTEPASAAHFADGFRKAGL
ncbi:MAG: tetratricopeptide repeat protein [Gammaproteobacteria bacterium]|nr:tetratricopeptide repeat protein [Gammaproteobacteria bacterium]